MLVSLNSLAVAVLTIGASWLASWLEEMPVLTGNPLVALENPSTLTLGLIGAGTIAIYLVARWRPARSDVVRWTGRLSDQPERGDAVEQTEQRKSRGAA